LEDGVEAFIAVAPDAADGWTFVCDGIVVVATTSHVIK
jgi:hypothetical protein